MRVGDLLLDLAPVHVSELALERKRLELEERRRHSAELEGVPCFFVVVSSKTSKPWVRELRPGAFSRFPPRFVWELEGPFYTRDQAEMAASLVLLQEPVEEEKLNPDEW